MSAKADAARRPKRDFAAEQLVRERRFCNAVSTFDDTLARRVLDWLRDQRVTSTLAMIGKHNSEYQRPQRHWRATEDGRIETLASQRVREFVLAPHIIVCTAGIEGRRVIRSRFPVMADPAGDIRDHFKKISEECRALGKNLMKTGIQPIVNGHIQDKVLSEAPLSDVLEIAAAIFDELQECVDIRPGARIDTDLRTALIDKLVKVFALQFGQPHDAKVAEIVDVVCGTVTTPRYVQDRRRRTRPLA